MSTDRLDADQIAALIVERVTDVDEAATWVAVVLAESGGDPVAYNLVDHDPTALAYLSQDSGLFQVNSYWHPELAVHEANRPTIAWEYAWGIATGNGQHSSDWSPWVAYTSGSYTTHLDAAYAAVEPLFDSEDDGTMTRYPYGYGTGTKTMAELRERYEPKMHPEFARRLFAWLESEGGVIGIGGGWRDTQPDRPGFAPDGKSFHQTQQFASGVEGYAAVDLVVKREVGDHRAPTWAESETAPLFGLHTFITSPPEPWHLQPTDGPKRGWQSWVNDGRLDPDPDFVLPTDQPDPDPPKDEPMFRFRHVDYADQFSCGASGAMHMTPGILSQYEHLTLVENDDREWLIHCCNDSGFDFARLTPI